MLRESFVNLALQLRSQSLPSLAYWEVEKPPPSESCSLGYIIAEHYKKMKNTNSWTQDFWSFIYFRRERLAMYFPRNRMICSSVGMSNLHSRWWPRKNVRKPRNWGLGSASTLSLHIFSICGHSTCQFISNFDWFGGFSQANLRNTMQVLRVSKACIDSLRSMDPNILASNAFLALVVMPNTLWYQEVQC